MAVIDSLFVSLGFEIDDKPLDEFKAKTEGLRNMMFTLTAAATAAAGAIGLFVTHIAEGIDELGDFAEQEQVNIETLQELGYAAKLNGSDLEALKSTVQGVNRVFGEAAIGVGRGAKILEKLGVSARNSKGDVKSFDEVLEEVSDRIQGMSRQEAVAFTTKLGIDRSLIPLLMKGKDALKQYREEAKAFGITTEADAQIAGEYADAMDRTRFMLSALAKSVAVSLMPRVLEMINGFRDWVFQNREIIKQRLDKVLDVLIVVIDRVWSAIQWLLSAGSSLITWLTTTRTGALLLYAAFGLLARQFAYNIVGGVIAGFKALASILTIVNSTALVTSVLVGGLILGIGLLIDDYLTWKEGGDSVIGDIIKKYPEAANVIKGIEETVVSIIGWFKELWATVSEPMGELKAALGEFGAVFGEYLWPIIKMVFKGWWEILKLVFPYLIKALAKTIEGLATLIAWVTKASAMIIEGWALLIDGLVKVGKTLLDFYIGIFMSIRDAAKNAVDWVLDKIGGVAKFLGFDSTLTTKSVTESNGNQHAFTPKGAIGKGNNTTNSNQSNTNTTSIQAPITVVSPDPAKAGESVRKELERMNKQTTRNATGGVAY